MQDGLVTASEAAGRLKMNSKAVSMWASRGWINSTGERQTLTPQGVHDNGARLYLWSECQDAERDTRRKRNRCHRRRTLALAT